MDSQKNKTKDIRNNKSNLDNGAESKKKLPQVIINRINKNDGSDEIAIEEDIENSEQVQDKRDHKFQRKNIYNNNSEQKQETNGKTKKSNKMEVENSSDKQEEQKEPELPKMNKQRLQCDIFQTINCKTKLFWVFDVTQMTKEFAMDKNKDKYFSPPVVFQDQLNQIWDIKIVEFQIKNDSFYQFQITPNYKNEIEYHKKEVEQQQLQEQNQIKEVEFIDLNNEKTQYLDKEIEFEVDDDMQFHRKFNINIKVNYINNKNVFVEKRENKTTSCKSNQDYMFVFNIPSQDVNLQGQMVVTLLIGYVAQGLQNKEARRKYGYVGIKNEGNTCYMNSFIQTLFHLKPFRNLIYKYQHKTKFIPAFQKLMYDLQTSLQSASTSNLIKSFGWEKKEATYQQDVAEFQCLLFDALEKTFEKDKQQIQEFQDLFHGELENWIRCTKIKVESSRKESFNDIKLNIKGSQNIIESFEHYTATEIMDGDNQYQTEKNGKQDAKKGITFTKLPDALFLHLKRFEYDYAKDENTKIMDRWEYTENLDLQQFVKEKGDYQYTLLGVLIHSGQMAGHGHYYAYMRPKGPGTQWYKFNDQTIEKVYDFQVFESNFGGTILSNQCDKEGNVSTESTYFSSTAYMLIYFRTSKMEYFMNENMQIPQQILQQKEEEDTKKKEMERRANYLTLKITCLSQLKRVHNNNAIFFFRHTKNQDYDEEIMNSRSVSREVDKKQLMKDFWQEISQEIGVKPELLTFWIITLNQNNKTELLRNFNYCQSDSALNKEMYKILPQKNTTKDLLLILPLQKEIKLEINQGQFLKNTTYHSLNQIQKKIFDNIIKKEVFLYFIKVFDSSQNPDGKLLIMDYFFVEKNKTIQSFIDIIIQQAAFEKLQNKRYKIYYEYNFDVTEITDYDQKLEDITKALFQGTLVFSIQNNIGNQTQMEEEDDTIIEHDLKQLYDFYNTNYNVQFVGLKEEFSTLDMKLDQDSDYYHIIDSLIQKNYFKNIKNINEKHIYLKAKMKIKSKCLIVDVPYPKYTRNTEIENRPPKYVQLHQLVKEEAKIYVGYSENIEASKREEQKEFKIKHLSFFENELSEQKVLVANKSIKVEELLEEVIEHDYFKKYKQNDERQFKALQKKQVFDYQDMDIYAVFIQYDIINQMAKGICIADKNATHFYKETQQQQTILLYMNMPQYKDKGENQILIIAHHFNKNCQDKSFDLPLIFAVQKSITFEDLEKNIYQHLDDKILQYTEDVEVQVKKLQNNQVTSALNSVGAFRQTQIKIHVFSNFNRDTQKITIDPLTVEYTHNLMMHYEENQSLHVSIEHINLFSKDNMLKLNNQ